MRRTVAAATLALLAATGAADARQHYPARGHRILPASAAALDNFTAPSGAYSFRKLRSAYAGPSVRIRRASDNLETDINFLGCTGFTGCPWDEAAAGAHCAATSCFIRTWYDQSGNARDVTQATPANQPPLVFNCRGTLPCMSSAVSSTNLAGPTFTPTSIVNSLSAVANRSTGNGFCVPIRANGSTGHRLFALGATANAWQVSRDGGGVITATAADAAWHSFQGVINGASSNLMVDGVSTAGTVTGFLTAGAVGAVIGTVGTCLVAEAVAWDAYALTPAEQTALDTNQRSFWGF